MLIFVQRLFLIGPMFMKMEKKQCTKCSQLILLDCFMIRKRTAPLTKCCIKCLDNYKMSRQQIKCKHGRQRPQCKDCGGCQICKHGRQGSRCKDCGGDGICQPNQGRSKCKDCGGGQICEHSKERSTCPTCGPHGHLA